MFVSDGNNAVLTNNDSLTSIENVLKTKSKFSKKYFFILSI